MMENIGYKFVVMADIPLQTKPLQCYVFLTTATILYTLLHLPWGKSLFAPRFWGVQVTSRKQGSF